jgi:hypothetical protein
MCYNICKIKIFGGKIMEKFIVVANFACDGGCDPDLYSSQWLVGTFDTVDECVSASLKDLSVVARDHYECVLSGDELEYESLLASKVEEYISDHWEREANGILDDLDMGGSAEIMSNDVVDADYTYQRQLVKYYIHKLTF